MIEAAIALAGKGMAVFPCKPRGKSPLFQGWQDKATRDADAVRAMWARWPEANVGIATGAPSGVWVLDIDGDAGEQSLRELELEHSALPATVEAITGGGGRHLLWRMPAGRLVVNSASHIGAGIDVKGDGGLIVAPPSIHPNGRTYRWSVDSAKEFAEAPAWLLERTYTRGGQNPPKGTFCAKPADFWETLIREGAPDGKRDDLLTKLAGRLLSPALPLTPGIVLELLHAVNEARWQPPLEEWEVEKVFNSICKKRRVRGEPIACTLDQSRNVGKHRRRQLRRA
jgi:hypothetical protein